MCAEGGGGGGGSESPPQATWLHTVDPRRAVPLLPKTTRPSSQKGERPSSSRRSERPGSSSKGDRKPPSSSRWKGRPCTSGPSSRKDVRSSSSSSRSRPSSSREYASYRQSDSQRRACFHAIPEDHPVQYTEDQTIIRKNAELCTTIDQYAENFHYDPKTRHEIIHQHIARTVIKDTIIAQRDSSDVDVWNAAAQLATDFARFAFTDGNHQRESHLIMLCELGAKSRSLMSSNPSTWTFGTWDEVGGPQSGYGNAPSHLTWRDSRYLELVFNIFSSASQSLDMLFHFLAFRLFASLVLFSGFANASPLAYYHVVDQSPFSLAVFFTSCLVSLIFLCLAFNTVSRSRDVLSKVFVGLLSAILFLIAGQAGVRVDQVAGFVLSFLALPIVVNRKCPYCNQDDCDGNCGQGGSGGGNDSCVCHCECA